MEDILQNSNGKYTISEKDLFLFVKTEIIIDVIDTYLFSDVFEEAYYRRRKR